jgi:hypothetical protein
MGFTKVDFPAFVDIISPNPRIIISKKEIFQLAYKEFFLDHKNESLNHAYLTGDFPGNLDIANNYEKQCNLFFNQNKKFFWLQ